MIGRHEEALSTDLPAAGEVRTYLDMQSAVGISKHMGGHTATAELYRLCNLIQADEVLEAGCGIGVGPVTIAQRFGCRVVALDQSERMLHWTRLRAEAVGVADRIERVRGDIMALPFEDGRFDAIIAESVLSFVEDKAAALAELQRVLAPGGWLGLNETFWTDPDQRRDDQAEDIGGFLLAGPEWRALWDASGLEEREIEPFTLELRQETRDRIGWVGWPWVLGAWKRVVSLWVRDPDFRQLVKATVRSPAGWAAGLSYALFVGRKPRR